MGKKSPNTAAKSSVSTSQQSTIGGNQKNGGMRSQKRSAYSMLALFILVINGSWAVYHYQYEIMPAPLTIEQAGKRGFSEMEAMKHVKALTDLGPHPVGSDALDLALQYVLAAAENIKKMAHWEVDVQVDYFHAKSGANRLVGGLFKGKTLVYSDLKHIVLRVLPKYASEAEENAILVSSHIDTVFSTGGAGDCSSCVAVMLEIARGISNQAHGFRNSVIFLFNTGEEEGLNGAHSFITQHPWSDSIRVAVDLEAMGIGGKSGIFQAGPHPWAVENFAMVAKYPSAQITAQDLFSSGVIKSATDFQVYKELAGLSGLDFAYSDNTAVYHTKNDKLELLKAGSLQHLGENMLAFLNHAAASPDFPKADAIGADSKIDQDSAVFFDILGTYMVVFYQSLARILYNSVILQSLLLWSMSLFLGGYTSVISFALSCMSIILMWIFSLSFSCIVAFVLPIISSSPVPFVSSPWLVVGLFAAPALVGALLGQHLGYLTLKKFLLRVSSQMKESVSPVVQAELSMLNAERWLFKGGTVQWLFLLVVGNYYKFGSSYLPLVWLVSPAIAYGFLEATLAPARVPKPLKSLTLLMGLSFPFLISAGSFIRLVGTIIGITVRLDRNPGDTPEWLGNLIIAAYISIITCLTLVYLLSYVHYSGAKPMIIFSSCILFGLSLSAVLSGVVPPFSEDTARAVNVVHVVDTNGAYNGKQDPSSYISLFSNTPGKLIKEAEHLDGFVCGREKVTDFVTFSVKYGCWAEDNTQNGWSTSDVPSLHVKDDTEGVDRITSISIDTKASRRWSLAINTGKIEDFKLKGTDNTREDYSEELVSFGEKSSVDGWHIIQFSGGKSAATNFDLTLIWVRNHTRSNEEKEDNLLLKLRTDVGILTPQVKKVFEKLPAWCSEFGKSTSPYNMAFLTSLPVKFSN
ncbi:endoplasmic reticulum metallopeptidase 1 [Impatiens glandulifera]|uniref:endoplasmic reticulum metallopeptidase 1 n=1 Tax=Impatiens glandulifera TaxID=253017 RepID=UPI001FB06FD5|nr:endoplasmic reticulum metallopeptidase 1 [Impatiens glandulifera]